MMTADKFILTIARVESGNDPNTHLGDNGRAAGRFQQHPEFYASWGPTIEELRERGGALTWDEAFEIALRKFFRSHPLNVSDGDIAVAYHLHGQHIYDEGDDLEYRKRFWLASF